MTIDDLVAESYRTAKEHGWWDGQRPVLECLVLVHSEISEAVEAYRDSRMNMEVVNGKPEGLVVELADAVIRIADLCGAYNLDLSGAVSAKLVYNKTRPFRHGGRAA
jgi:hypothetical protein